MIVIDASAMVELLVGRDVPRELLTAASGRLCAPHLIDFEVLSVLRGLSNSGSIGGDRAERARSDFFDFTIARYAAAPLADHIWRLRHNFTSYDASYIALAEAIAVPLYTCDRKLLSTTHRADVRVMDRST